MPTSTTPIPTETDLIGTLQSNLSTTGLVLTAVFIDKKTGVFRGPQSSTKLFTIDQNNSQSETILADSVNTDTGTHITTITINASGRNIPKYGTGSGSGTGLEHVVGSSIGCVDVAYPINLLNQISSEKANLAGAAFTGPVDFTYPSGTLRTPNLTQTQIDGLVATEGMILKNTTTGAEQMFLGGIWNDIGISTPVPNASETVAGKVQLATNAQMGTHTSTGTTGARLVAPNDQTTTTSSGASSANKLVTLASSGKFDRTVIPLFGGNGSDGALNITSGTTNINLGGAAIMVKNYSTISITGSGALTFSNPNANGTLIILKSQGNVTLTSSATPLIDVRSLGGTGGIAVTASTSTVGTDGSPGITTLVKSGGGQGGQLSAVGGDGGLEATTFFGGLNYNSTASKYLGIPIAGGGGSGDIFVFSGSTSGTSGAGGRGAGSLVIECGGALNYTTANGINASGENGGNGTAGGSFTGSGGGGGGGGGYVEILYNTLTTNTGTIIVTGGTGGNGNAGGQSTGGGGGGGFLIAGDDGTTGAPSAKSGGDGAPGISQVVLNQDF